MRLTLISTLLLAQAFSVHSQYASSPNNAPLSCEDRARQEGMPPARWKAVLDDVGKPKCCLEPIPECHGVEYIDADTKGVGCCEGASVITWINEHGKLGKCCDAGHLWSYNQGVGPANGRCCLVGSHMQDGKCVPACPPGTYMHDGRCVPACPPGTHMQDGKCVPACPPGTYMHDGRCIPACPPGTHMHDGRCVPACPPGTHMHDGRCVPACPPGTYMHDGKCVPACPPGTYMHDGRCVPACPPGTHMQDGRCVPACPPGTYMHDGKCVPVPPGPCPSDRFHSRCSNRTVCGGGKSLGIKYGHCYILSFSDGQQLGSVRENTAYAKGGFFQDIPFKVCKLTDDCSPGKTVQMGESFYLSDQQGRYNDPKGTKGWIDNASGGAHIAFTLDAKSAGVFEGIPTCAGGKCAIKLLGGPTKSPNGPTCPAVTPGISFFANPKLHDPIRFSEVTCDEYEVPLTSGISPNVRA